MSVSAKRVQIEVVNATNGTLELLDLDRDDFLFKPFGMDGLT